jgi:hypothetical protein
MNTAVCSTVGTSQTLAENVSTLGTPLLKQGYHQGRVTSQKADRYGDGVVAFHCFDLGHHESGDRTVENNTQEEVIVRATQRWLGGM